MIGTRTNTLGGLLALLSFFSTPCWAEKPVLHIYTWAEYIPEDIKQEFEQETGIKVTLDFYDSNDVLEAKLLAGNSGFDLVFPTAYPYLNRQIRGGLYQPLDPQKLQGRSNLDPWILGKMAKADPENRFTLPYTWGTAGIAYDANKVKKIAPDAPLDSLALLFDPHWARIFSKCGMSLLEEPIDVIPVALSYLGRDPNSFDPKDIQDASEVIRQVQPYINHFNASRLIPDLANGNVCMAQAWSGYSKVAEERAKSIPGNTIDIRYVIPKEGASLWIDVMAIPQGAPHPENAHKFMSFILRPKIMARISEKLFYASGNLEAKKYLSPAIVNDSTIYPTQDKVDKLYVQDQQHPSYEKTISRAMIYGKTGR